MISGAPNTARKRGSFLGTYTVAVAFGLITRSEKVGRRQYVASRPIRAYAM